MYLSLRAMDHSITSCERGIHYIPENHGASKGLFQGRNNLDFPWTTRTHPRQLLPALL